MVASAAAIASDPVTDAGWNNPIRVSNIIQMNDNPIECSYTQAQEKRNQRGHNSKQQRAIYILATLEPQMVLDPQTCY